MHSEIIKLICGLLIFRFNYDIIDLKNPRTSFWFFREDFFDRELSFWSLVSINTLYLRNKIRDFFSSLKVSNLVS